MRCWTILALLVAVCAVFLGVGHTEETEDDLREIALEDAYSDSENDVQLADSFMNAENDDEDVDDNNNDEETENALKSVDETPSNDEDEPEMLKRAPRRRRRRRRRLWRRRGWRSWGRKLKDKIKKVGRKLKKFGKKIHNGLKKACRLVKNSKHKVVGAVCRFINGDEEFPLSDDETVITEQEAVELLEQGWQQRDYDE